MATDWSLKVLLDVPEPRVDLGRLVFVVDGTSWDKAASDTSIYFDPVTNTGMLAPLSMTPEFETTFTGDYSRLANSDFSFPTPAKWVTNQIRGVGDYFHESQGVNEIVTSRASVQRNQPIYFAGYIDGVKGSSDRIVFSCGWGYGYSDGIKVEVLASGKYRIYKGANMVGEYSPSAEAKNAKRTAYNTNSTRGKFFAMTMIPCRWRDLLIIDANGSAVCHTFKDLSDPANSSAYLDNITPSAPIWFYVPSGKAAIQAYLVRFKTSGNIYSQVQQSRYPFPSGWSYLPGNGFHFMGPLAGPSDPSISITGVNADGSALTTDGVNDQLRVKIALSSSSSSDGVGVYFADIYSDPTTVDTSNTNTNITTKVESLSFQVGEDGRVSVSMSARKKALEDAGVNRPHIIGNRTFAIQLNNGTSDIDVVRGTLDPPEIEFFDRDDSANNDLALLSFKGTDRSGIMDRTWFQSTIAYDNLPISGMGGVINDLIAVAGFDPFADTDLDIDDTKTATSFDFSLGKWSLLPERGDTVGKWIDKIHEEYCSTWTRGWMPDALSYVYRWKSPNSISPTPVMTLYQSIAAATTAGVTEALRPKRVIRRLRQVYERPEANQIQVLGQDPHTGELLWATMNDTASQEPTTAPASRPTNWLGAVEPILYQDPGINNLSAVGYIALTLSQRLTPGRDIVEWESDLLVSNTTDVPVWIGDVVRIKKPDGTTDLGDYMIVSIPNVAFTFEGDGNTSRVRNASYKAVKMRVQALQASEADNSGMFAFPR